MAPSLTLRYAIPGAPTTPKLSDLARVGFQRKLTGNAILP
jgi:hypothetical protein